MTPEQQRIWDYMTCNALGIGNAKKIREIASSIGVPPRGTNNDDVRNWINRMVVDLCLPIGTCRNGAFIILNDDEREIAAQFVARENRADAVRRNGNYTP
ncbi:MAG TPA: hypothetical protein PK727_08035 [Bacteroidales bacterium]|jgi:hypothetical protein|nr:hypothetical protein [Bacteroidales bacterium]HNY52993.1 hypothetical protein [Bacteroidales bacterium]HOG57267.1 hypothetical protein [Bacteroidales bacterium]HQB86565.1 hypothetical protein [Bacteroidales bacterium]